MASGSSWFELGEPETKQRTVSYPVIDSDPHFYRVVRYFRPADYLWWAALTVAAPTALVWEERIAPSGAYGKVIRGSPMRRMAGLTLTLGFTGGFLLAYTRSANRFNGLRENYREYKMDYEEMSARVKAKQPLYGVSTLPEHQLRHNHYNSSHSQLLMHTIPWFNFVNHPFHGRDVEDYSKPFEYPDLQAQRDEEVQALRAAAIKANEELQELEKSKGKK